MAHSGRLCVSELVVIPISGIIFGRRAYGIPGRNRVRRRSENRLTAETQVETDMQDARRFSDIDECPAQPGYLRCESNSGGAEVVVIVFGEAGQELGEGVFPADPDVPP